MAYKTISNKLNIQFAEDINENFEQVDQDIKNLKNQHEGDKQEADNKQTELDNRLTISQSSFESEINQSIENQQSSLNERMTEVEQKAAADQTELDEKLTERLENHENSTTAHKAEDIEYSGSVTGADDVKKALEWLKTQTDNVIAQGGNDNTEVVDLRLGADNQVRETAGNLSREIHQKTIEHDAQIPAIAHAKAEIVRNSTHSGFLNLSDFDLSEPNKIKILKDEVAYVNGYEIKIPKDTVIELEEAPTEGSRDDLIFLEAWFENQYELSWRIRTVAGVDFKTYPSGLGRYNTTVLVQGSNSSVVNFNADYYNYFYTPHDSEITGNTGKNALAVDKGIYVAGDGTQESKGLLQTADGYVYAIPMFRIKRRSSGGYSVENVNGAREYVRFSVQYGEYDTGDTQTIIVHTNVEKLKVGDKLNFRDGDKTFFTILEINGSDVTVFVNEGTYTAGSPTLTDNFNTIPDRPDNLYYNIIDQRDIIDLRHKVSLIGVDYNKVMNEEFNRLLSGENGNVEMVKEYFGLQKAPSYAEVQQDSYPYVVENLAPPMTDVNYGNTSFGSGSNLENTWIDGRLRVWNNDQSYYGRGFKIPITAGKEYTFSAKSNHNGRTPKISLHNEPTDLNNNLYANKQVPSEWSYTFTAVSDYLYVLFKQSSSNRDDFVEFWDIQITKGNQPNPIFVPSGKWYLPYDYANQDTNTRFDLTDQKRTLSDAQTSQKVSDKIEVLSNEHLPHIEVMQSVEGVWTAGDTITVKCKDGIVSGVIDEDTALAKLLETPSNTTIIVDDVSKLTVGDKIKAYTFGWSTPSADVSIVSIDSNTNTVTISSSLIGWLSSSDRTYIIETTADTSTPNVKADGINGTWSDLATSEATYTIDTVPADNTADILIEYSVNYAGGQGIEHVPTQVLQGEVNGQKLVKNDDDGIVTIRANFEGKNQGDTDLNPHKAYRGGEIHLKSPDQFTAEMPTNDSWAGYNNLLQLNSNTANTQYSSDGEIPQQLFSFNILRAIQDKLGEGFFEGCVTIEDKVQRAKDGIYKFSIEWYGYGENPNGNTANLKMFRTDTNDYNSALATHSSSIVSMLNIGIVETNSTNKISNAIDQNGFVHFLAYTDPSDGVTPSTIYTDYVELELQIDVSELGYDVLVPEEPFPVLSENLLTQNQAFPVDLDGFSTNYAQNITIDSLGILKVETNDTLSYGGTQTDYYKVEPNTYYTASVWLKGDSTKVNLALAFYNDSHISSYNGDMYDLNAEWTQYVFSALSPNDTTRLRFDILGREKQSTTMYLKNLKLEKGINPNPTWTPGRKSKQTLNYLGKTIRDNQTIPHKLYSKSVADISTLTPQDFSDADEVSQFDYDNIGKQNGVLLSKSTNITGETMCLIAEFDLSKDNLSLSNLKELLRKITVLSVASGEGDNDGLTYGLTMSIWDSIAEEWWVGTNKTNSDNLPSTISQSLNRVDDDGSSFYNVYRKITNNQKVYILVHSTHPASADNDSIVYTDYIKLDVELSEEVDYQKANVIKVRKETKEIKMEYPITSHRTGVTDNVALWYEYVPYVGLDTKEGKVLATSDFVLVTNRGTGLYVEDEINFSDNGNIITTYLPKGSDISDHLFLNEIIKLTSPTSGTSGLMPTVMLPIINSYRLSNNAFIGDTTKDLPSVYTEDLASAIPHLGVLYGLVNIEGEIYLRIKTNYRTDTIVITGASSSESDTADYKVKGNILIKEV
ncbi:hypothetical protein [Chengkuizengella axinellae]|uniref:CBM-cenC domain-containing protein n=1 Tax=Chengkuizengella axinellae TaxID=3064388 RepID=A0ABT9IYC8_9BACL|nr:hypothetical protein [Chengkuizengella sp. 2205SS18-9]MDP5274358.1 hypothetical protein [Chengkuizengella sp. 2205SS18-9]